MSSPGDFLERMNEISRRQGKAPIDPTYIQGSGAPWPAMPETEVDHEDPAIPPASWIDDEEPRMTTVPVSTGPTVVHETRGEEPEVAPSSPPAQQRSGQPEVVVWGDRAWFKDTEVKLNEGDVRMIVHVILNAAHRTLRDQMEKFGVAPARRRRKKVVPVVAEAKPVVVKRRKGRQRLDGSIS